MTSSATTNSTTKTRPRAEGSKAAHDFPPQFVATHQANPFDWRQVESPDYKEYIANLRAIGCPEKTVQDIITADVNELFSSRRSAIMRAKHYEYWKATPVNLTEEEQRQLRDLNTQKWEVLKALGVESSDFTALAGDFFRGVSEAKELQLQYLSVAKRQSLNDLLFRMGREQLAAGEDHEKLAAIEQETQSVIGSLLTPDELHEYELRTSLPAMQLRSALKEVEPTEQEFRTVFDLWTSLHAHPHGSPEYRQAQQASETALQQLLGPTRFQSYLNGVRSWGY